jgi:hypothetical protein
MNKHLRFIYLLLLLFCLSIPAVRAQSDFKSEDELKKQAAKLFDDEEFEKAYPLYSQLVSLYKKDPTYNYRLGVCMLYASDDKEKAILYLELASKSTDVDKEVFFYLAKAYHLNYRFDDAIAQYKAYKKVASNAKAERLQVDRQIEMCDNGKKLLRYISDLMVLEKTEMNREDFFRNYDISGIGGKLIVKPDEKEFRTSLDKKKKESSIIYLAPNSKQIYFSSYGSNDQHGKDIYQMKKLPSGEWGKAEVLGKTINTDYDEDYPFLHPNGKILYFCSKGHNSMGGYDIFKSTLDEKTNTWGEPVNLDFPINTPDDDILYITDKDEKKAYFSSARSSAAGKIAVYHINVERKPIDAVVVNGTVLKDHRNQTYSVKITVKNMNDNMIAGIFNSNSETGAFNIKLPNVGGRFLYTVESDGFEPQSQVVEIPVQKAFKPLKQEISYEMGTDKLVIKNSFDTPVDDGNYLLALNLIKEKSKLDVTSSADLNKDTALTRVEPPTNTEETGTKPTKSDSTIASTTPNNAKLSNDDIVKIAYKDANDVDTEATNLREQADIALSFANQKNEAAQSKFQEGTNLTAAAAKENDNTKKQALTDQANAANKDAAELNEETVAAFNLAKKLDINANAKKEEADLSQQYAKGLEAAVKSKNPTDALAKLDILEKKLDTLNQVNARPSTIYETYKREEDNKKKELDKTTQVSTDLKQDMADNKTVIANLQSDADKSKSSQLKQALTSQIEELQQENVKKQKELEQNDVKVAIAQKGYDASKSQTALVNTVIDKSKTATSQSAAANVASIDKNKLEQHVNDIKNATPTDNTSVTSVTNPNTTSETTADALTDINKKYEKDLATAEKNKNKADREQQKAEVLKQWSQAIDANIVEQKLDLAGTTDTVKKAVLAKRISDAENSSKEKKTESDKSLAKADKLKGQGTIVAATASDNKDTKDNTVAVATPDNKTTKDNTAATTTTENKTTKDNTVETTTAENKATKYTASIAKNKDSKDSLNVGNTAGNKIALTGGESYGYNTASSEPIANANSLNKESDDLTTQSTALKERAAKATKPERKKALIAQAADLDKQSKAKKLQADQQVGIANKTEYTANQNQLEQYGNTYTSDNPADDISIAGMISDESKLYFNKAQEYRKVADTATSDYSKEDALKNAYSNEMIALEKQKKATDLYKNHSTAVAIVPTIAASNSSGSHETQTIPANKTNNVVNSSQENSTSSEPNNTVANNPTNPSETKFVYTNPAATEQIKQANVLDDQASDLMAQSLLSHIETTDSTKPAMTDAQSKDLIQQAQSKKLEAFQLVATANKTEYSTNQDQLDQLAKASASNNAGDLLKAEIINDESKKYFDKAQQNRKDADLATSYYDKETALQNADENEKIALEKQKESLDIYKNYNPNTTIAVNNNITKPTNTSTNNDNATNTTAIASNPNTNQNTISPTNTTASENPLYSTKAAAEQISMAESLNKQANELMGESASLKSKAALQTDNVDAKNTMNGQADVLTSEADEKKIDAAQLIATANTSEYSSNHNQLEQLAKASAANNSGELLKAEILNDEAQKYFDKAQKKRQEAAKAKSSDEKDIALNEANENEKLALGKQKESIDIYRKYSSNTVASTVNNNTVSDNSTQFSNSLRITLAPNEHFEQKSTPTYSAKNPIPVDPQLPSGLIFKVQIGAFERPIPQNLFKGISPITGENTKYGYIRYTAGLFVKFTTADKVKDKIKQLGYKDAFVVAFLDGKRIPINDAYAMAQNTPSTVLQINNPVNHTIENNATSANTANTATNTENNNPTVNQNKPVDVIQSQTVSSVNGLFYTVQVGVYAQPVPAAKLYSMKPLYSETAPNGNIRYYTGIYKSIPRANEAKEMVNDIGVKDAFITAYYNGKRITMKEAKQYETQGDGVFSTSPNLNKLPTFKAVSATQRPVRTVQTPIINATQPSPLNNTTTPQVNDVVEQNTAMPIEAGIVFKVQIGAFNDEVPLEIANKFLAIAKQGIRNYKDESGLTIYTVGDFKSYKEADDLKTNVVANDLKDAFVVAYKDGKKISVDEARQQSK